MNRDRLKILVWHIHGTYLNCMVQAPHDFYLPIKTGRPEGYGGRGRTFEWPDNAIEVPAEAVRDLDLDLIVYQTPKNYFEDQYEILSEAQRRLPRIYLEHNTPKGHPTDTLHPMAEENVLLVHVTHFNALMWDSGHCATRVIEHAALPHPDIKYRGELDRGIVVVNGIERRRRIAGLDVWQRVRERVPVDLVGMDAERVGGVGDFPQRELLAREADYRFFFNPIRYTSLPLAVVEAMMIGLPIVALATTELPTVIFDGFNGFISNDINLLVERMCLLLKDRSEAERLGRNARNVAEERFNIARFVRDWDDAFRQVV
ncbi:MAG: glycosyltransferase family 4 protein [Chloroflexi bacterium]|nr:glycosyltransferase family 4 protein [Chloroflexota bacterium]